MINYTGRTSKVGENRIEDCINKQQTNYVRYETKLMKKTVHISDGSDTNLDRGHLLYRWKCFWFLLAIVGICPDSALKQTMTDSFRVQNHPIIA
jgi:hypothetical protein